MGARLWHLATVERLTSYFFSLSVPISRLTANERKWEETDEKIRKVNRRWQEKIHPQQPFAFSPSLWRRGREKAGCGKLMNLLPAAKADASIPSSLQSRQAIVNESLILGMSSTLLSLSRPPSLRRFWPRREKRAKDMPKRRIRFQG